MLEGKVICSDPKRKHIRTYLYISENSFLSVSAFNFLFFVLGFISISVSFLFLTTYPEEGGLGLIFVGILLIPLGICLIVRRYSIVIENGALKITNYLDFFGTKKVFKTYERSLEDLDPCVIFDLFPYKGAGENEEATYGNGDLWFNFDDGTNICILQISLSHKGHSVFFGTMEGQRLFLDTMEKLEKIIGREIRVKDEDRKKFMLQRRK